MDIGMTLKHLIHRACVLIARILRNSFLKHSHWIYVGFHVKECCYRNNLFKFSDFFTYFSIRTFDVFCQFLSSWNFAFLMIKVTTSHIFLLKRKWKNPTDKNSFSFKIVNCFQSFVKLCVVWVTKVSQY